MVAELRRIIASFLVRALFFLDWRTGGEIFYDWESRFKFGRDSRNEIGIGMGELQACARRVAALLTERGESLAVGESSAGGLISAALVEVPGASAFYVGGCVIYTAAARHGLLGITSEDMTGIRSATEAMSALIASRLRERLGVDWALAETGASGPKGNRYGDAAGHCCLAVSGPQTRSLTLETASDDRSQNMERFAIAALAMLEEVLKEGMTHG